MAGGPFPVQLRSLCQRDPSPPRVPPSWSWACCPGVPRAGARDQKTREVGSSGACSCFLGVCVGGGRCPRGTQRPILFPQEGKEFAESNSLLFMETSAKLNLQVSEAFSAVGE